MAESSLICYQMLVLLILKYVEKTRICLVRVNIYIILLRYLNICRLLYAFFFLLHPYSKTYVHLTFYIPSTSVNLFSAKYIQFLEIVLVSCLYKLVLLFLKIIFWDVLNRTLSRFLLFTSILCIFNYI